jgi:hypothetical protein
MNFSLSVFGAIILVFFVLRFAKKIVVKLIGFLLISATVVGLMYYKSWGPFEHNIAELSHLQDKYCISNADEDICECIVQPIESDMNQRFTTDELQLLTTQRIKAAYVLKKSMNHTKEQALLCLEKRNAIEKYKQFIHDFIPIENKYLSMAEDKVDELTGAVKDEVTTFNEGKTSIDDKY